MTQTEAVPVGEPTTSPLEPDLKTKIRYRLGRPIPEEYKAWVVRDIDSPAFRWRQLANHTLQAGAAVALVNLLMDGFHPWASWLGLTIASVLYLTFSLERRRQQLYEWHEKKWKLARERAKAPDLRRFP